MLWGVATPPPPPPPFGGRVTENGPGGRGLISKYNLAQAFRVINSYSLSI